MAGFSVQYASYVFTNNGRAHVTRQARYESDAVGARPHRALVTYSVVEWFLEDTYAANQTKYQAMLAAIRAAPEAPFIVKDENGTQIINVRARPQGDNLPDQWGQHMTECTVEFTAIEVISGGTVDATAGAVALKNVTRWSESIRADRPTFQVNDRRESIGSVIASGRVVADPALNEADRRSFLQTERDAIMGLDGKQVALVFGSFSKTVRMDNVTADIKDGSFELEWTIDASYRNFPSGTYVEAEYEVGTRDDRERSERITSIRGKIRANALSGAQTKLDSIVSTYLVGNRTLRRNESSQQLLDGPDGSGSVNYNELSFTLEYREPLDIVNWTLTLTDRADAKGGQLITTYSGRVTALIASSALAKARDLGMGIYPLLLSSSEALTSSQIGSDQEQFVECAFSYEYARQGTLVLAEVNDESGDQTSGVSNHVVSGSVTGATEAAALAMARSFKPTGQIELSEKESTHHERNANGDVFTRVEFSYIYARQGALVYAEVNAEGNQQTSGNSTDVVSGVTVAATEAAALTLARSFKLGSRIELSEKETTRHITSPAGDVFVHVDYQYTYARQSILVVAEVQSETNDQTFGESTTVISGFAAAATEAAALVLARSFKPGVGFQLSARESSHKVTDGSATVFTRVEFNYVFHAAPAGGAIEYGEQIVKDMVARETTVTLSGTAIAETEGEADGLIDAVLAGQSGHVTKDERTRNWAQAQGDTILRTVTFSVTTVGALAAGGDDIIEAEMTLSTTYSVDHAVFTPIPFGLPFVQTACGGTAGIKQVSGSIRALNIATARSWGRGQRSLATSGGYEDPPEERETTDFLPFSGTTVKAYRFAFTYSAKFQSLAL